MTLTTKHQRLAALRPLSPESVASLAAAWDVRMVYESNSIEGSSITLRETFLLLCKGIRPSGRSTKECQDTLDLGEAWQVTKKLTETRKDLDEATLKKIWQIFPAVEVTTFFEHSMLQNSAALSRSMNVDPASLPRPEFLPDIFGVIPETKCPVEHAALLHWKIATHKRFGKKGGVISRLAMNFILLTAGYPPISIPTNLRQDYYNALEAADSGNFQTWQNFLSTQLHQELDEWLAALDPASSLKTEH